MAKAKLGEFDTEMTEEFMRAFAVNAGVTLHVNLLYGANLHHIVESLFKGLGRALRQAVERDERVKGVPSTKGVL
jgi:imidazoleglycerol-phosphate dehydratase